MALGDVVTVDMSGHIYSPSVGVLICLHLAHWCETGEMGAGFYESKGHTSNYECNDQRVSETGSTVLSCQ